METANTGVIKTAMWDFRPMGFHSGRVYSAWPKKRNQAFIKMPYSMLLL